MDPKIDAQHVEQGAVQDQTLELSLTFEHIQTKMFARREGKGAMLLRVRSCGSRLRLTAEVVIELERRLRSTLPPSS